MRLNGLILLVSLLVVALAAGCGKKGGGTADGDPKDNSKGALADGSNDRWSSMVLIGLDKDKTGSVVIEAIYEGAATPAAIDMGSHQDCAALHGDTVIYQEAEQVNADKTVPWTFVHVTKGLKGTYGTPNKSRRMDQKGCVYVPHVMGVMAGQPVFVYNSDKTGHNINAMASENIPFNKSQAAGAAPLALKFDAVEMNVRLACNVHSWMNARVHVMKHPYFTTTGVDGSGKIPFLPPGKYTLSFWHETWKAADVEVEVKTGAETKITVKLTK